MCCITVFIYNVRKLTISLSEKSIDLFLQLKILLMQIYWSMLFKYV